MDSNKDTQDLSFGIVSANEAESIDNVMLNNDDYNYLNLIAECIAEISQAEAQEERYSVEDISERCKIYKYYTETTLAAVEEHFSRSLPESLVKSTQGKMNEKEGSMKKTGAAKRKAKRKPTVTSLLPYRTPVTSDARVHPYSRMPPVPPAASRPQPSPPLPNTVEMCGGAYYMTSLPQQHCLQYQTAKYIVKTESWQDAGRPPVYTAFYKENTLIEVYAPSVGRGFNPRYNSLLIEPTIPPFLPRITGLPTTVSAAMVDKHIFHQMAIEFNIPPS